MGWSCLHAHSNRVPATVRKALRSRGAQGQQLHSIYERWLSGQYYTILDPTVRLYDYLRRRLYALWKCPEHALAHHLTGSRWNRRRGNRKSGMDDHVRDRPGAISGQMVSSAQYNLELLGCSGSTLRRRF